MQKFREERRAAMRSEWKALAFFTMIALGCGVWLALGHGWGRVFSAFFLDVVLTSLWFGWMLGFDARSSPLSWGASGEQWTAEELEKLESPWRVYHDLPDGRGNWDHVVVGPPGVFVIDTKNFRASAKVDDEGLRSGRLRVGGKASRGSALRMNELIQRETGLSVRVQGVVAVWGELVRGTCERDKVLYVPAGNLTDALTRRPARLGDVQHREVCATLDALE